MYKRKNRKACMFEKGKEVFDFDTNIEMEKYCYLCGEKMSRNQWKNLKEENKFETYDMWKKHIEQTYKKYPIEALKEFSKFLNHRRRMLNPILQFVNPYISAMFSAIFSIIFTALLNVNITKEIMKNILTVTIFYGGVIGMIAYMAIKGQGIFWQHALKNGFYKDYQEVIDDIIKEKYEV